LDYGGFSGYNAKEQQGDVAELFSPGPSEKKDA
jgi:hypothetical protein